MKTEILRINKRRPQKKLVEKAAAVIKKGGLVAFPTETVYGLGADALNKKAVSKIFRAKGRPPDNPLIVHITDRKDLQVVASGITGKAEKLISRFWPGPLTLIFRKKAVVPDNVTCGMSSVAVRMPSNKIAIELIRRSGVPIAAPSANISGKPSPTSARHVVDDMWGKIPIIISGGRTDVGLESTVIDMTSRVPVILRPGKISAKHISSVIGKVLVSPNVTDPKMKLGKVSSPGMKYRHYSPDAEVVLVCGTSTKLAKSIGGIADNYRRDKKKVYIIGFARYSPKYKSKVFSDPEHMAKGLFSEFRRLDRLGFDVIIVEGVKDKGIGLALMNRLRRAAARTIRL